MSGLFISFFTALLVPLAAPPGWSELAQRQIGYTELQTNLPGGRHENVRTMRAVITNGDGTGRKLIAEKLIDNPNAWTQFVGWSPDNKQAIVYRAWEDPENARWEEKHKTFRFDPKMWLLDSYLVDLATGKSENMTSIERVSHYNAGLFFLPGGKGLGFTPLIDGNSKPFVMDLDGRNKRDVSGKSGGFAYGYSASPDGKLISYHDNYQIYVAHADGTKKQHIATGNPFNFGPRWSPDGKSILFLSGVHGNCHLYLVQRDGQGLKKLADRQGYQGWIAFLDVPDYHNGSSDVPVWSADGKLINYTASVGDAVELFQVSLDGKIEQLTKSAPGTLHYHPEPSADGKWLMYGSKRDGVRQLIVMRLTDRAEKQITKLSAGRAAMWAHWQESPK